MCKLALVVVGGTASAIGAIVMFDRIGKGIRTAPRDAMISLSSSRERLGAAFGVHRAMDTTGAMIGPLIAFGLLALAPLAFHSVFLVSFCFALAGLGVIVLLVPSRPAQEVEESPPPGLREMGRLLAQPRFRGVVVAAVLLGLTTISDAFLYLALQRHLDLPATAFPLLFVGASAAFMLLAVPAGRLADRVGRGRVFVLGYAALLPVYASLVLPAGGAVALAVCLTLVGASYAATDGVLAALGAATLAEEVRASGLAVIGTATNAARLLASVAFGAIWTVAGLDTAVLAAGAGLVVALAITAVVLARTREVPPMARRNLAFAVLTAACAITVGVVVALAALNRPDPVVADAAPARARATVPARPYLVFRSLDRKAGAERFGVLAVTGAADPARGPRRWRACSASASTPRPPAGSASPAAARSPAPTRRGSSGPTCASAATSP